MKLHKLSLFGPVAGALMLMSAFAPRAEAAIPGLQYYFDFNLEPDKAVPPYTSRATGSFGGTYPTNGANATQTTLFNGEAGLNLFTTGSWSGISVQTGTGTLVNAFDADTAGGAIRLRGNSTSATTTYCYTIGAMNFTGLEDISITYALKGGGTGGFTDLTLAYSFDNTTFTDFATVSGVNALSTYTLESANLPTATDNASSLYISFCFTGSTNTGVAQATFIDNIQITAAVPEPTTAASGVLAVFAVFGLCWSQRRRLIQSLRLRRT
jgi:hypothetical protein